MSSVAGYGVPVTCPETRHTTQIPPALAAMVTGRCLRTAQRWAAGGWIDKASQQLLALHVFGVLPWPEWQRWRIGPGWLHRTDLARPFNPDQVASSWITYQQVSTLKHELARLRARLAEYEAPGAQVVALPPLLPATHKKARA